MEERLAGEEKEGTRGLGRIRTEMSAEYEILLPALQGGCAVAARNLTSQVAERRVTGREFQEGEHLHRSVSKDAQRRSRVVFWGRGCKC